MADVSMQTLPTIVVTTSGRVKDLVIKDGQLIFVKDANKLAFDWNGIRTFYRSITELPTEADRTSLLTPIEGHYYFVIDKAVLWTYQGGAWVQMTMPPQEIVFIGEVLPELGSANTLYVDKTNKNVSVWNKETTSYDVVAEKVTPIPTDSILKLFS